MRHKTDVDRIMEQIAARDASNDSAIRAALASVFGDEWIALDSGRQALIVRDCLEDPCTPDVDAPVALAIDLHAYRRSIGPGNLHAYADTQRARFGRG